MDRFADLPLPAPLADAIAGRGYETATPVQIAVLEERCAGRDLLVSSQTGSGKTLAFGVLLAQALLDADAPPSPGKPGRTPSALVIAPTRELANQVRAELAWLLAKTRLHVAAFTGGSDIRRDFKQLQRGVDVAVGTPGRLVDLWKREALVLGETRAVVLDEADEMLDMGFRDDLEALLGAAAARQRTHMFSATLPRPILGLAAHYQREAVRVDARAAGESGAHADIEYVAHVVAEGNRLAAVVNVLRMHADAKAIVFGTTREGVAELHQALAKHGFRAVLISGDRAQSERDRAIAALKSSEAQVLVATNVAARGLDLPEVDLVVHADLPLNADSLTHRSGRTGRAGRKGRSVLIAVPAERRKAERLLAIAKTKVAWTPAPTAEAVAEAGRRRLEEELLAAPLPEDLDEARGLARRLGKERKKEELLELLLLRELGRCPVGESLEPIDPRWLARPPRYEPTDLPPRRKREDFERDAVVFRVNLGADKQAQPSWLLPLICRRGGVTRNEVGAIRVGPTASEFQIAGDAAADFALAASRPDPRAPQVVIERHEPRGYRPPHASPQHRPPHASPQHRPPHASPQHTPPHAPPSHRPPHAPPPHRPPHASPPDRPPHVSPQHTPPHRPSPRPRQNAENRSAPHQNAENRPAPRRDWPARPRHFGGRPPRR